MKKISVFVLILLLPVVSTGQGQLGVTGGYILYRFTSNEANDAKYTYSPGSFSVALSIRQRNLHTFSHGLKIEYTYRSFHVKSDGGGLGGGTVDDFTYTIGNIYLHFQPQFTFGSKPKFYIFPGFYFGTLLHSTLTGTEYRWQMGGPSVTDTLHGTALGYYPKFEFGIAPGFGIEYPCNRHFNIIFEYRLNLDLADIGSYWVEEKTKMLGMGFELGVAYTFSKKIPDSSGK